MRLHNRAERPFNFGEQEKAQNSKDLNMSYIKCAPTASAPSTPALTPATPIRVTLDPQKTDRLSERLNDIQKAWTKLMGSTR